MMAIYQTLTVPVLMVRGQDLLMRQHQVLLLQHLNNNNWYVLMVIFLIPLRAYALTVPNPNPHLLQSLRLWVNSNNFSVLTVVLLTLQQVCVLTVLNLNLQLQLLLSRLSLNNHYVLAVVYLIPLPASVRTALHPKLKVS
jgi:hypothetical protein